MEVSLFKCSHPEHAYLLFGKETPVATTYILLCQTSEVNTVETDNLVTKVFKDATHNTVATTVYLNTYLLAVCLACIFNGVCMYFSVLENDAICNLLYVGSSDILVEMDMIDFLLQELRSQIDNIDEELLQLLARRSDISSKIGVIKKENNLAVLQLDRWNSILSNHIEKGKLLGLKESLVKEIFEAIHKDSIDRQL